MTPEIEQMLATLRARDDKLCTDAAATVDSLLRLVDVLRQVIGSTVDVLDLMLERLADPNDPMVGSVREVLDKARKLP